MKWVWGDLIEYWIKWSENVSVYDGVGWDSKSVMTTKSLTILITIACFAFVDCWLKSSTAYCQRCNPLAIPYSEISFCGPKLLHYNLQKWDSLSFILWAFPYFSVSIKFTFITVCFVITKIGAFHSDLFKTRFSLDVWNLKYDLRIYRWSLLPA